MPPETGEGPPRQPESERERQYEAANQLIDFVEVEIFNKLRVELDRIAGRHPEAKMDIDEFYGRLIDLGSKFEELGGKLAGVSAEVWIEVTRVGED